MRVIAGLGVLLVTAAVLAEPHATTATDCFGGGGFVLARFEPATCVGGSYHGQLVSLGS